MLYRNGYSILGFGCMRLPSDYAACEKLILRAIDGGINYFDTAYIYFGKEALLGKILSNHHCRDQVMIATKLPSYLIRNHDNMINIFETELKRLQTDHVDNYLMHMLPDLKVWNHLRELGIEEWLAEKKAAGQIRQIGFSFHGSTNTFLELLDAYPWDFCQIQYNYMDENSQAGRTGLLAAYQRNIPVIIMEPLRGGTLTNGLSIKAKEVFQKTGLSPASWGLRWLWAQKEVTCVLSGMNTVEMLDENIEIASVEREFTRADRDIINEAKTAINANMRISCTGCSYCMPCPHGVDIPGSFRCYNVSYSDTFFRGLKDYLLSTTFKLKRSNASLCVQCGRCERLCPQQIKIRSELQRVKNRFENTFYKAASGIIRILLREKRD